VGLSVSLSARGAESLPAVGDEVRLWTHLAVREDGWTLYGFPSEDEREMFRLLISVTGIGPKLALGILSAASPVELAGYLQAGDEKGLTTLPGIGAKSAARLVIELGQRVPARIGGGEVVSSPTGSEAEPTELANAVGVLTAMGLTPNQAEQILLRVKSQQDEVSQNLEHWVRAALAEL
jgi:Holliday junction DNA helicase RuvA